MSISTYSDAACLTELSSFNAGATVYLNGDICLNSATTGTTVKLEIYDVATSTLRATPLNTTYNFPANVSKSIKTDINAGTAPSWNSSGAAMGEYYAKVTISGTGVETTYDYEWFSVYANPSISAITLSSTSIKTNESSLLSCSVTNSPSHVIVEVNGDTFYLANTSGTTWSVLLYGSDVGICTTATLQIYAINTYGAATATASDTLTVASVGVVGEKNPNVVSYMLRHLITANISDPLSQTSRGSADITAYFSGTARPGQVNYLPNKPTTAGRFQVTVGGTPKTDGVDFILSRSAMTITWTGTTPASGSDNIVVSYQAIKGWVYDDHPFLEGTAFPRITVAILNSDYKTPGIGIYHNYDTGIGMYIELLVKVIIRNRKSNEYYTYGSLKLKNFDLVNAIAENVIEYVNTHREVPPWKFYDLEMVRSERIITEEDTGVFRDDVTIRVRYWDKAP